MQVGLGLVGSEIKIGERLAVNGNVDLAAIVFDVDLGKNRKMSQCGRGCEG